VTARPNKCVEIWMMMDGLMGFGSWLHQLRDAVLEGERSATYILFVGSTGTNTSTNNRGTSTQLENSTDN